MTESVMFWKALSTDSQYKKSKNSNEVVWCDLLRVEQENTRTCVYGTPNSKNALYKHRLTVNKLGLLTVNYSKYEP